MSLTKIIVVICIIFGELLSSFESKNSAFSRSLRKKPSKASCLCVPSGSCDLMRGISNADDSMDGGIINYFGPNFLGIPEGQSTSSEVTSYIVNQNTCQVGFEKCCPKNGYSCGIRYPPIYRPKPQKPGQALYGSYPWQAVILDPNGEVYIGSGALINNRNVITAAHKINSLQNKRLKVRLGEWDASSPSEPIPSKEFTVIKIFIHQQFSELTLQNDIAILRLSKQVEIGSSPVIGTICLTLNPVTNMRCFVAGWGKNDFESGSYQAIMKEVDVPIIDPYTCQVQLRETRLGQKFVLDTKSFVCAGGEFGKDACTGDGGSPLVCNLNNRWYLVGLVAWGIGCGQYNVPGVYVNVPNFISWIEKIMKLKT